MDSLSGFLDRFRHLSSPERAVKGATVAAVKQICGVELNSDAIAVRGDTVLIQASSALKSEIGLHNSEILAALNKALSPSMSRVIKAVR